MRGERSGSYHSLIGHGSEIIQGTGQCHRYKSTQGRGKETGIETRALPLEDFLLNLLMLLRRTTKMGIAKMLPEATLKKLAGE
jgi:hypothetical protein